MRVLGLGAIAAAVRALRIELEGGPRAELPHEVRELAELLTERELARLEVFREPAERELLAAMPDAAAVVAKDGRVRACNTAFDALAAGGKAAGLTPLEATRSAELSEAVKRALEGTARRLEVVLSKRVHFVHLAPLLRGEVLLLARDVTDEKRAQATRRDFVANASHELRTPISAIRAAAETLLAGAVDDRAAARGFVEIVGRHAERLARLTDDLLDLSRLESRQWRFELGPVEVAPLARQVLELHAAAARAKGVALEADVEDGLTVRADARALEQVLVNLVDNAVKYTPAGSVVIRAEGPGGHAEISVTDTGPGIERRHLERIFERFYRVDPGRAREAGGTGLGLAIVKHLAQGMDGEVGVESGAAGTRFWIRLPLE
ncbi:MAG TPA: ATP-binding protein [Anaeromyxobacteraceae bacterium]|nr:ATP-binding protein [Anaeromyxobacteraceae bacterium]